MSVVVEFSISGEDFPLGSALTAGGDAEVSIEGVVPIRGERAPYVWVSNGDLEAFERGARAAEAVLDVTRLDRLDGDALYRVEWSADADGLLAGLAQYEAVVLEATWLHRWRFRVRFHDHALLREFYVFCRDHDVDLSVTRVSVLEEKPGPGPSFDLTAQQRRALVIAVEEGHFEVPRRIDLPAIAGELGISERATSNRIRRGVDRVLRSALLGPEPR